MIPAIPVAGTADTAPLVTQADYQLITSDTASTTAEFNSLLPGVLNRLQRKWRRTLLYAQYTERLYLYKNGIVYPTTYPLDVTKLLTNPGQQVPENVGIFQGAGIWVGWFIPLPSLPVWQGVIDPQTDITYWAGYVGSGSTGVDANGNLLVDGGFELPDEYLRVICRVLWYCLNPVALVGVPHGAKSQSVGGVTVAGVLSMIVDRDPALCRDIKRLRKPQVKAWDAQVTGTSGT